MYSSKPLNIALDEVIMARKLELLQDWQRFQGVQATISAPSAAWVDGVKWTYEGFEGGDPTKIQCRSSCEFEWNEHGKKHFDIWDKLAKSDQRNIVTMCRGGACYFAGPYQNKQIEQLIKNRDLLLTLATNWYRSETYQTKIKPVLLSIIEDEHNYALEVFERCYGDPDLAIGNKPLSTGTGLVPPFNTRESLRDAFRHRDSRLQLLKEDINLSKQGQLEMYSNWPFKGTLVSGFSTFVGLRGGSRDDSDVEKITQIRPGRYIWHWVSKVRGVNTLPHSWTSNNLTMPSSFQREQLAKYKPPSYMHPMDKDFLATFIPVLPCTSSFAREGMNVAIDLDWGAAYPAPHATMQSDALVVTIPKEKFKSGADQLIGVGCATVGRNGHYTLEMSSGRPATRRQYQATVDWSVQCMLDAARVTFRGGSNGDDQVLIMRAEDVPKALKAIGVHARMKGSSGNWTFRAGRQIFFDSPDHMHVGIIPRPTKTSTTAQALSKMGEDVQLQLKKGESQDYIVGMEAMESVATTFKIAPQVFYMEGSPSEIAQLDRKSVV